MSLPNYKNPPLSEVVFGVWFEHVKPFKAPHIGAYWQIIKEEYPLCEQVQPIGDPIHLGENLPFPLPRTWFINKEKSHLIQLQNNCFFLNWRKQEMAKNYPRYETLFNLFLKEFQRFVDFVKQENIIDELKIRNCELSYINHIEYKDMQSLTSDFENVLPNMSFKKRDDDFLPKPISQAWRIVFPFPEDFGALSVSTKQATRNNDNVSLLILELSAKGLGQKNSIDDLQKWFKMSHEWIVKGFADLTSQEAQNEMWELIC